MENAFSTVLSFIPFIMELLKIVYLLKDTI